MKPCFQLSWIIMLLIVWIGLCPFQNDARCNAGQHSSWDEDGGLSFDYSDIPRLQWMGPGEPDTYAEYAAKKDRSPFAAAPIQVYREQSARAGGPKVLVLVNSGLYAGIIANLNVYIVDLQKDGYDVELYTISGGTEVDLKVFILSHSANLVGCVFVGSLPVAWYEMEIWGHEQFPCDLFYMDLDGEWTDNDGDGLWDGFKAGDGDEGPEIFIGHINASTMSGDETDNTNAYFVKNHAFRDRQLTPPNFGLTYTEDDWAGFNDMKTHIKYSYPDFQQIAAPNTTKADYRDFRIPSPDYEFIQLACHSSSQAHYFTRGGMLPGTKIMSQIPQALFYNLFCCSSLRYTTSNFLGGAYIYNASTTSLAVIGSTKTGSMLSFRYFYEPFGMYETFGEAFRQWFNALAPYNNEERAWHFGMTIAGDPFLSIMQPVLWWDFPDGLPEGNLPPGPAVPLTVQISSGDENIIPGSAMLNYRFDSNDPFLSVALESLGNDLYQAMIPALQPGDEPEYYFSAMGDQGNTAYSPCDAPNDVYSFNVCFEEVTFFDDFEDDLDWTVENTAVIAGEWERFIPSETTAQPGEDHSEDGYYCYVTGWYGAVPSFDDLDGGPTRLISPTLDAPDADTEISFYLYFYHSTGGVQQPLEIELSSDNGINWVNLAEVSHTPEWTYHAYRIGDYITPSSQVKIRLSATDNPDDDIVEALLDDFSVRRINASPSLWADAYSVSVATGGSIGFMLDAGADNSGRPYLLLGSMSGTYPGRILPGYEVLPLNWDDFTRFLLGCVGTPICQNFVGYLDAHGQATAKLNSFGPIDPIFIGMTVHFAYLLAGWQGFDFTSNPIPLTFEP